MKFSRHDCTCGRRHRNLLAIGLGVVAVLLASSGTAVAVTMTAVQITDPKFPTRAARVDPQGRLSTANTGANLAVAGTLQTQYQNNYITSPTTTQIAISRITLTNPKQNTNNTTSETEVFLRKINVGADGTCATGGVATTYTIYTLEPGDDIVDTFPSPIIVSPTGTTKYCLSLYVIPTNSDGTIHYFQYYAFSGYTIGGGYTGIGVNAQPATGANAPKPKAK